MREGVIPPVKSLSDGDLEDTGSVSYESGTGLLFVLVLVALAATAFGLISFAH
jgi:hypothetical protein